MVSRKFFTRLAGLMAPMACIFASAKEPGNTTLSTNSSSDVTGPVTRWSLELGSGATFSNVRDRTLDNYTLVPIELTLSRTFEHEFLTDSFNGALKGRFEASLGGYYSVVATGVEHYIAGYHVGTRYDFTGMSRRLVPFLGCKVGMGWADAHQYMAGGNLHGLGQDFNFNFEVLAGLEYSMTPRTFMRLTAVYSHFSNAGLSEPEKSNKAIDALGPMFGVGWRF